MLKTIVGATLATFVALGVPVEAQSQMYPTSIIGQASSSVDISQQELEKFVNILKQIEEIDSTAQQQMAQAVQEEGLTPERFIEIGNNLETGSQSSNTQVSSQEQTQFKEALTKVQTIAEQAQSQKKQVLEDQGFDIERFNQIVQKIQQDPSLKEQVQQMLQK